MENIPLPAKIEIQPAKKENETTVSLQPCHPGYGTTLGNALRRVLISSLPGAAVTAFKIKGASHEFSTRPHVKEDLVEISLNLKQLRLKVFSDQPVRLELKVKGEKKVLAKDIKPSSDVEIINTDLLIATLTNKDAELEMEMIVTQGRGYVPTEAREKEDLETDMIMIDSIYTPVKNVGIKIENVRVGQMTNYENLLLSIETDGTITPQNALNQSTQILLDHFNFIAANLPEPEETKKRKKSEKIEEETGSEEEIKSAKGGSACPAALRAAGQADGEEKAEKKRGRKKKAEK